MDEGVVQRSERTLRLLSEMWTVAREEDLAIGTLSELAELARDGEADARIAQLRLDRREADLAVQAARRALEKGVEDRGPVRLVLGMAYFQQGRHEEAKAAFREAMASAESRTAAAEWIAYIEREQERLRQLEASAQP
jgi:tetratricopeptide (TPR) repeat protein